MNVSRCIIGHYRWPDYFVNVHEQSPPVTPPRSEGSVASGSDMLRCAQHDRGGPCCPTRHNNPAPAATVLSTFESNSIHSSASTARSTPHLLSPTKHIPSAR